MPPPGNGVEWYTGMPGDLVAFGEFTADGVEDIVVTDGKEVKVLAYKRADKEMTYEPRMSFDPQLDSGSKLQSVIPVDLDFNGQTDLLLVVLQNQGSRMTSKYSFIKCICHQVGDNFDVICQQAVDGGWVEPLLVDVNLDGYPDLIGEAGSPPTRTVWINGKASLDATPWSDLFPGKSVRPLARPHSSATVDLNGDCQPDLVFTTAHEADGAGSVSFDPAFLEIWVANSSIDGSSHAPFTFDREIALPAGAGQVSWADINADGTMDLVVPVCGDRDTGTFECRRDAAIFSALNHQVPMCQNSLQWTQTCRRSTELCTARGFAFAKHEDKDGEIKETVDVDWHVDRINATRGVFDGNWREPGHLAMGDTDANGYVDLAMVLKDSSGFQHACVLRNCPCKGECQNDIPSSEYGECRKFEPALRENGDDACFPREPNTVLTTATFADPASTQGVHLLLWARNTGKEDQGKYIGYKIDADQESKDHYHILGTAMSGICARAECLGTATGQNYPGPSFKITVTDVNGHKKPRQASMLSQSAYHPLLLPSVYFGLGRTNNYVEEFYLGMPVRASNPVRMWVSIIPNTAVVAMPNPRGDPEEWTLDLVVSPSTQMPLVFTSVLGMLIAVGMIILFLERRERMEDQRKQQTQFYVHFVNA
jgi:integrin alpha FG-GAP repeat containing protein 1